MDNTIREHREAVRIRRNEALRQVADAMQDGIDKYGKISELLSAYGIGIGSNAIEVYASRARKNQLTSGLLTNS